MRRSNLSSVLALLSVFAACSGCAHAARPNPFESIRQKLSRPIHPQFGAGNFDILDYPQEPLYELRLTDLRDASRTVEVRSEYAGRVLVLVEVGPTLKDSPWNAAEGTAPALDAYAKIREEFAGKAEFVTIWTAVDKKGQVDAGAARAYVAKHKLPGPVLLNETIEKPVPRGTNDSAYHAFAGVRIPGHRNRGTDVCILNEDGLIVYRAQEEPGVDYHTTRHILRRLTDKEYDAAVRREFQPEKSRALPACRAQEDGLLYSDDFEGYADSHAFKLEPRWGFTYTTQSRLDLRPSIATGAGRNGSKAVFFHTHVYAAGLISYGLQHRLPAPLSDGYIRFYVRRHSNESLKDREVSVLEDPRRALCVRFDRPASHEPAGFLLANGDWMKETFVMSFHAEARGPVDYSPDKWHEVVVTCMPGGRARVAVDGREVGRLDSEAVDWIGFRMDQPGKAFYVDDVEVFYRGDAARIAAAHKKALAVDVRPVEPFTEAERIALARSQVPTTHAADRARLGPDAIPRADIVGWKTPYLTFDHPVPAGELVLDDLRRPGVQRNILEEHKGKIIWVTRTHKGDHNTERNNRGRTARRSPTVFNRVYRLLSEYRPKGVVVLGVSAHDGGHRHFSASHEDRVRTSMENAVVYQAIADDLKIPFDQVIYGFKPDAYDGIFAERFSGQMRLWTKTKRGRIIDGTFAGFGPDAIIDREGRIVFRGAGPDGSTYWQARYCLDRLLDPTFDAACRQEFRNPDLAHYKSPVLPVQEQAADGLYYCDDFESYKDAYDFGLHPRWGFTYERFVTADAPAPFEGEGRNGSKAILVNRFHPGDQFCGNKAGPLAARHEFPAPLTNGHFRLHVRRGPDIKFPYFGRPEIFRLAVTFYGPDGKVLDTLTTTGERGQEHFVTVPTDEFLKCWNRSRIARRDESKIADTGIAMAATAWQEIRIVCVPGKKAIILIDGKSAATLAAESVTAVELRAEVPTSYYVDDAELFYAGEAARLQRRHAQAVKADLARRQAEWKAEADLWEAKTRTLLGEK